MGRPVRHRPGRARPAIRGGPGGQPGGRLRLGSDGGQPGTGPGRAAGSRDRMEPQAAVVRFRSQIGLPRKRAAQLIRFDHAAHRLAAGHSAALVAADSGYADQSHLHRDVMTFTGVTPRAVSVAPWLAVDDIPHASECLPDGMTGDCAMTEHMSGDSDADDRFVRLDDGDMHVVEDGKPAAPAVLLIHGTAGSTAWWDPVVPRLADAYRVIRVDLPGHGRPASPTDGYDIPTQARRVGAALDRLGAGGVAVIGHSTGGTGPRPWPSSGPTPWRRWRSSTPAPARAPTSLRACSPGSCWPRYLGGCCGACEQRPPSARPCAPPSHALSTFPTPSSRTRRG